MAKLQGISDRMATLATEAISSSAAVGKDTIRASSNADELKALQRQLDEYSVVIERQQEALMRRSAPPAFASDRYLIYPPEYWKRCNSVDTECYQPTAV